MSLTRSTSNSSWLSSRRIAIGGNKWWRSSIAVGLDRCPSTLAWNLSSDLRQLDILRCCTLDNDRKKWIHLIGKDQFSFLECRRHKRLVSYQKVKCQLEFLEDWCELCGLEMLFLHEKRLVGWIFLSQVSGVGLHMSCELFNVIYAVVQEDDGFFNQVVCGQVSES